MGSSLHGDNSLTIQISVNMEKNLKLSENWNVIKEKLKQKFTMLTEKDIYLEEGKQNEMLERIQVKCKITREELIAIIKDINTKFVK
jgi:hypothetical protein